MVDDREHYEVELNIGDTLRIGDTVVTLLDIEGREVAVLIESLDCGAADALIEDESDHWSSGQGVC